MTHTHRLALVFILFAWAAIFAVIEGCEHGSLIPIDPDVDVCATEGVEDCCPDVSDRYDEGFQDGVDSVVCETPEDEDETCEDDTHKVAHKNCRGKGHHKSEPISRTECRTECVFTPNGTQVCETICVERYASLACDPNCDLNDPICIPCDLGDFS